MRSKIYHDLEKSPIKLFVDGITFTFSSILYLKKFQDGSFDFIYENLSKFKARYRVPLDPHTEFKMRQYFAIAYYQRIEKRGNKYEIRGVNNENREERISEVTRGDKAI